MSAPTMMSNMIQTQDIKEETIMMMQKKQGIVTILGSGCDDNTASAPNSLRRTLSADMSSKKWLKKIASSEELFPHHQINTIADSSSSSSSEDDEDYEEEERKEHEAEEADAEAERERLEIWSTIQRNKKEEQEKSSPVDTWGSIMSTLEISKSLPVTPYVHPLVKRTKSSLSEKSLEICTESLGSETGSDGLLFSSESGETEKEEQQKEKVEEKVKVSDSSSEEELADEEWYNNNHHVVATTKKSPPRSFPPPLPSLSFQAKGSSLHMRPHRDNGRLVLEAVSLPPQNNFNAQRQDGRLVLTFTDKEEEEEEFDEETEEEDYDEGETVEELDEEEFGDDFDRTEKEQQEQEEEEDEDVYEVEYEDDENEESEGEFVGYAENVIKEAPLMSSEITTTTTATTNVHRLALMMNNNKNKPIGLVNRNPNWSEKFKKGVNFDDVNVVEMESLPPRARVARLIPSPAAQAVASGSFNLNAYEYYWRTKPTTQKAAAQVPNNNNSPNNNSKDSSNNNVIVSGGINQTPGGQQQLLVLRGKNGDYLVHNLKSCKDSRRSLMFWEPYCIATS